MPSTKKLLQAAAGSSGEAKVYVEDVFSTYLYAGTDATQIITNGVDMTEGGLVWCKTREVNGNNVLVDSEYSLNNANKNYLISNTTSAGASGPAIDSFNSTGFTLNSNWYANSTSASYGGDYVSWSFRKAEKFFDVLTYSGNDVSGRTIAHNLNSKPGMMIVKQTNGVYNWQVYHTALGAGMFLEFNTGVAQTSSAVWNNTNPTDSVFTVGNEYGVNQSGKTYVAYLFADNAGGYGDTGNDNIIKCGYYAGNGTVGREVTVGFEPQFIMIKSNSTANPWAIMDIMRGATGTTARSLQPNSNSNEQTVGGYNTAAVQVTATGFTLQTDDEGGGNGSGVGYLYMAIRRPMKTPAAGTEVFTVDSAYGSTLPQFKSGFVTDLEWNRSTEAAYTALSSRMQGAYYGRTNDTSVPALDNDITWDFMNGWGKATWVQLATRSWMFKRAAGFMDIVCYTGTGSATSFNHNLGVTPLLQIIKRIDSTSSWYVNDYALSPTSRGFLNAGNNFASSGTEWSGSSATTFSVYASGLANINTSGATYANYLFATVAGVSKVGSYTGTAANLNVPCGFSNGARFILIKRTDSTGDWYYWDYFNGISAGNDPYLLLNELNAQVTNTDYIDPLSSGFTVTSSAPAGLNASGGRYLFLAIA